MRSYYLAKYVPRIPAFVALSPGTSLDCSTDQMPATLKVRAVKAPLVVLAAAVVASAERPKSVDVFMMLEMGFDCLDCLDAQWLPLQARGIDQLL